MQLPVLLSHLMSNQCQMMQFFHLFLLDTCHILDIYLLQVYPMKQTYIDLHTHSHCSDGLHSPEELCRRAVEAGTDGVKFHLLHVLHGTDLEKDYLAGKFNCLTLEEYAQWLKLCLAELPPHVVVHRITGDGAKRDLVAPLWSGDKKRVLNYLRQHL